MVNGGFFTPREGEVSVFRFEPVQVDGATRIRVRLSSHFAHAQPEELKNFVAFEMGRQLAVWSGKSEAEAAAYGMAFYLQSLYRHKTQWESFALLEDDAVEHALFLQRYGLPAIGLDDLLHRLEGDHPEITLSTVGPFVTRMVEDLGGATGTPRSFGRSFTVRSAESLYDGTDWNARVSRAKVQAFVASLDGLSEARVLGFSPADAWADGPRVVTLGLAGGVRRTLVIDLHESSGKPTAAHLLDLDLRHVAAEKISLTRAEWSARIWSEGAEPYAVEIARLIERELGAGTSLRGIAEQAVAYVQRTGGDPAAVVNVFGWDAGFLGAVYTPEDVEALREYLTSLSG